MFRFNFANGAEESAKNATAENLILDNESQNKSTQWLDAKQVFFSESSPNTECINMWNACLRTVDIGNITIKYLDPNEILKFIRNSNEFILQTEQENTDLRTAIYEGGLKLWNGTFDMLECINTENLSFSNMNILDLGCGNGLVGLYALLNGAANVTFQDYNEDVLKYITKPNTELNLIPNLQDRRKFFAGDWQSFSRLLPNHYFDFILTSDTIYNCDNYEKLHAVFENLLKKTGKIFLAAKTIYFGLSGTIRKFQDLLNEKEVFESKQIFSTTDGVEREVLEIKFRSVSTS